MSEHTVNYKLLVDKQEKYNKNKFIRFILPFILAAFFLLGLVNVELNTENRPTINGKELYSNQYNSFVPHNSNYAVNNISVLDTIYTKDSLWIEIRIDEQKVHVHYRDGSTKTYLVSTGDSTLERSIATRSGLFAIFSKTPLHYSQQYERLRMHHYQAFNMGIGFHGSDGDEYYNDLGKKPLSHGCVRMRREDALELFYEAKIGTLVLAHSGESARTIAFAPKGFENNIVFEKEDQEMILAHNLKSIYQGDYYTDPPIRFIINPKIIPSNGYYLGNKNEIAKTQSAPDKNVKFAYDNDKLRFSLAKYKNVKAMPVELSSVFAIYSEMDKEYQMEVNKALINNYAFNERGILPYFPPQN